MKLNPIVVEGNGHLYPSTVHGGRGAQTLGLRLFEAIEFPNINAERLVCTRRIDYYIFVEGQSD